MEILEKYLEMEANINTSLNQLYEIAKTDETGMSQQCLIESIDMMKLLKDYTLIKGSSREKCEKIKNSLKNRKNYVTGEF